MKAKTTKTRHQPNTALALAQALHRYARIDEPADMFDAVCADWPHRIAVLVNDYLFYEIDEGDPDKWIATLERDLNRLRAFREAYPDLRKNLRRPTGGLGRRVA